MIVIIKCFKHTSPLVVEVFNKCDKQAQEDALAMAAILRRRDNCEYKVMIDYWDVFGSSAE